MNINLETTNIDQHILALLPQIWAHPSLGWGYILRNVSLGGFIVVGKIIECAYTHLGVTAYIPKLYDIPPSYMWSATDETSLCSKWLYENVAAIHNVIFFWWSLKQQSKIFSKITLQLLLFFWKIQCELSPQKLSMSIGKI